MLVLWLVLLLVQLLTLLPLELSEQYLHTLLLGHRCQAGVRTQGGQTAQPSTAHSFNKHARP